MASGSCVSAAWTAPRALTGWSILGMGLTNAILTGFTGINSNQVAVEVIGNNVANVNTTAFKSSRALFETLFVQTVKAGTAPDDVQGGTNPVQFGYGSGLATTQRNFTQGSAQATGVASDLAIDGGGLFILRAAADTQVYTRDGSFTLNSDNMLVSANGSFVQGFSASEDGTVETGSLSDIRIPVGQTAEASATTTARMVGNVNAASETATTGSRSVSGPLATTGGNPATATTPLTTLVDANGAALFSDADVVTIRGVQKGGIDVPEAQFIVGIDGTTYGDLAAFLQGVLRLDTGDSAIGSPGVTVGDGTTGPEGALIVASNAGDVNAISLDAASIRNSTTGIAPFTFTTTPAIGEGATTSFIVFDSLGTPVEVRLRMVLESSTEAGNQWRFTAESSNDAGALLGGGTVTFDQNGRFVAATGNNITVAGGAASPLAFEVDFQDLTGLTNTDGVSALAMAAQNGFPEGILAGFAITPDGVITGTFSNGLQRVFGQIGLATFANTEGLSARSENTFVVGPNSGEAVISAPLTGAAGRVNSGQLELSNVDLSRELIGLITASTGFSAASRTVRTADDMLQELMLLVR